MYAIYPTRTYTKSLQKIQKQKKFNLNRLNAIIDTLAKGERLPERCRDHQLTGDLAEYRECHVLNDLLLKYKIDKGLLVLILIDIGTHSQFFG